MRRSQLPRQVLVTGAYGLIGNSAFAALAGIPDRFEPYGMVRRVHASDRIAEDDLMRIADDRLRMADVRDARAVRRVVYASTNQVVFGYRDLEPYRTHFAGTAEDSLHVPIPSIRHDQPTSPPNLYACSKIFGESLASMYSRRNDMSFLCLRIGWVTHEDVVPFPSLFCSRRDVVQAIVRAIEAPDDLRFDVFFVHSDNTPNFVDISHTREVLGYRPEDRGEDHFFDRR